MYVEAAIDFVDEEIKFLRTRSVLRKTEAILQEMETILSLAKQGSLIREGATIVIAGRPNAGKSTLLNTLSQKEIAIVTDVPGTTRDVMREYILLDDIPLHIIDTAGLRKIEDIIEQEGIRRAWQVFKKQQMPSLLKQT